jgi:hypothetical protein
MTAQKPAVGMLAALFVGLVVCGTTVRGGDDGAKPRPTAPAVKQDPVDFNHPPREYVARTIDGWSVLVEKQLVKESPLLAKAALSRLAAKLSQLSTLLPPHTLPDLQKVKIFLMFGQRAKEGGRSNGLEYFRRNAPRYLDWLDPRMGSSIVIFDADNYVKLSQFWALKALVHEFAHAHHLEHWPEAQPDIYDTWDHAMKAGLYQTVRDKDKGTHMPNYAARNHLEYFAELSAMYFVGCNYFPHERTELKAYDPDGYALVEKLWGVDNGSAAASGSNDLKRQ